MNIAIGNESNYAYKVFIRRFLPFNRIKGSYLSFRFIGTIIPSPLIQKKNNHPLLNVVNYAVMSSCNRVSRYLAEVTFMYTYCKGVPSHDEIVLNFLLQGAVA